MEKANIRNDSKKNTESIGMLSVPRSVIEGRVAESENDDTVSKKSLQDLVADFEDGQARVATEKSHEEHEQGNRDTTLNCKSDQVGEIDAGHIIYSSKELGKRENLKCDRAESVTTRQLKEKIEALQNQNAELKRLLDAKENENAKSTALLQEQNDEIKRLLDSGRELHDAPGLVNSLHHDDD